MERALWCSVCVKWVNNAVTNIFTLYKICLESIHPSNVLRKILIYHSGALVLFRVFLLEFYTLIPGLFLFSKQSAESSSRTTISCAFAFLRILSTIWNLLPFNGDYTTRKARNWRKTNQDCRVAEQPVRCDATSWGRCQSSLTSSFFHFLLTGLLSLWRISV